MDDNKPDLAVSWTPPDNAGRPVITSYDLRYREEGTVAWINGPQGVTGTSATIENLTVDTVYEVQVRGTNADGDGDWSPSGQGTPQVNAPPVFTSSSTFSAQERQRSVGQVRASDPDSQDDIVSYALDGGVDEDRFSILSGNGTLSFQSSRPSPQG